MDVSDDTRLEKNERLELASSDQSRLEWEKEGCAVTKLLHSRPEARREEGPSHCYQNLVRLWLIKIVKLMEEGQKKD